MKLDTYFSLRDIVLMSLMAGLVIVLRLALRIPMHLTGKSGLFWVIPIIVCVGITQKLGTGTYIGVVTGILAVVFGLGSSALDGFNYLVIGVALDVLCFFFKGHLDNLFVGILIGAAGHLCKLLSNSYLDIVAGTPVEVVLISLGYAAILHAVFGGIGGGVAALVLGRLYRSGVVKKHER